MSSQSLLVTDFQKGEKKKITSAKPNQICWVSMVDIVFSSVWVAEFFNTGEVIAQDLIHQEYTWRSQEEDQHFTMITMSFVQKLIR